MSDVENHRRNNAAITMGTIIEMREETDIRDIPGVISTTDNNTDITNSMEVETTTTGP